MRIKSSIDSIPQLSMDRLFFWRPRREYVGPYLTNTSRRIRGQPNYITGQEITRKEFNKKYGRFEYWRNLQLLELVIMIRRLEEEENPESNRMAQRLRQIYEELYDQKRAEQSLKAQHQRSLSAPSSPISRRRRRVDRSLSDPGIYRPNLEREQRSVSDPIPPKSKFPRPMRLPPSAIAGRITGGNFPRRSGVADFHPGFSQMTPKTQSLLRGRHEAAQRQHSSARSVASYPGVDRRIETMRRYDIGLRRDPYTERMYRGEGLDVDRYRREVPQILSQRFRDLRRMSDRKRETDSHFTKLASQEVWRQRQLDKKYHPKPVQRLHRQHEFGPQESQQYSDDWKGEAKKVMPFAPLDSHFGEEPSRTISREPKPLPPEESKLKRFTTSMRQKLEKPVIPSLQKESVVSAPTGRERSWSRSGPDLGGSAAGPSQSTSLSDTYIQRRPTYDPERLPSGQRLAANYLSGARVYDPIPRQKRLDSRRLARPFREDDRRFEFNMNPEAVDNVYWGTDPYGKNKTKK